jgi:hypothetical protein
MVDDDLVSPEPPQDNVGGADTQLKRKRGKSLPKKVVKPKAQPEPQASIILVGKRIKVASLRADVSAPQGSIKRAYHVISVHKPDNQRCIRTFPSEYWLVGVSIVTREGDGQRNKPYLFSGEMAAMVPNQVKTVTLAPYIDRQSNICMPLKHNDIRRPNDYNSTALFCANAALTEWGHVINTGTEYDWVPSITKWADPEFPAFTIEDLINKAFPGDRYVDSIEHDFMQELLGI